MNVQCIAYVTDQKYFFPTAVSALQARHHAKETTDIVIVLSDVFSHAEDARRFCNENGIKLIDASTLLKERFSRLDIDAFSRRITVSAMGRLLLSEVLPTQYTQVIYIDGDTQIGGSLAYLEELNVPSGKLAAARDYLSVCDQLDGKDGQRPLIFNSGVLKFDPRSWIGARAFEYFIANGGDLHDQGALNAVIGDNLILLSSRWNFPKQFLHLVGEESPTIVHFMAHPKPWDGRFFPWSEREAHIYQKVLQSNPVLRHFSEPISPLRYCLYSFRSLQEEWTFRLGLGKSRLNKKNFFKVLGNSTY